MADIAAGDVTYVMVNQRRLGDSRASNRVRLSFGNGTLTYPANGIPLTKGKMGCPVVVESLRVVDQGVSGYVFTYDQSAEKLVVLRTAATATHTHALHFNNADVADGATTRVNVGTNLMGAGTGADIAVAGVADTTGAGGIVAAAAFAAATLAQASTVAIDAQEIEVEVIGW